MTPVGQCEECGADSGVYDSRASPKGFILRQRKCLSCDHRWPTYEVRDEGDLAEVREKLVAVSLALSEAFSAIAAIRPKPKVRRKKGQLRTLALESDVRTDPTDMALHSDAS